VVTLAALTSINLFNYVDRFVLSALFTDLEKPVVDGGLALTKAQQGELYSAFIIVYALTSPIFGVVGDRWKRMWLIGGAVALWSVATAAGGFAIGMASLLVARACTGVGEAAYASIAPSVISDLVPRASRGRALAIFNAAIPIGAALGFMLGGLMVVDYGWRTALMVAGVPGMVLAFWVFFLKEPARGALDPEQPTQRESLRVVARNLTRKQFVLPVLGYVAQTAGFGALAIWAPSYLEQAKGISPEAATTTFGAVIVVTGLLGTIAGGWLGDRWLRRDRRALLWTCAFSSVLAVPCVALVPFVDAGALMWTLVALGSFFLVMSVGPINAQIVNVLRPTERATGIAVSTTLIHLLGDVPSVPFIGWLADEFTPTLGAAPAFDRAFLVIPLCIAAGAVIWIASAVWGCKPDPRDAAVARGSAE
jgi:MFS family permease